MSEIILLLKRTVFLPKGSPGICSVREIKADIRHYEVATDKGRIFCSGEVDLLIEYLSFASGKQYPGYEGYEHQMAGGGSMWQALLTIPFDLVGEGGLSCPPLAQLSPGELDWFMVSPHALEMRIKLHLNWQEVASDAEQVASANQQPDDWRQITLEEMEAGGLGKNERHTARIEKEECLSMEHDDKIMRLGVSDQGWRITTCEEEAAVQEALTEPDERETTPRLSATEEIEVQETVAEEIAAEEICEQEIAAEEAVIEEVVVEEMIVAEDVTETVAAIITETIVEEITVETTDTEPLSIPGAPLLNIQTVETPYYLPVEPQVVEQAPYAPPETMRPATRSRAAGLPQLQVRREQIRRTSSYQVNIRVDDKQSKE